MSAPTIPKLPLDAYTFRARVLPTLVVGLPVALAALVWFPQSQSWWGPISGLVVGAGGMALLAQLGRDLGKRKERSLFEQWGGSPTTRLLRHRDPLNNQVLLGRRHQRLRDLLPDQRIPTHQEEQADIKRADDIYEACSAFLKERTRNKQQFPLVFEENCNYGFRRNLWGMKPLGVVTSAVGTVAVVARIVEHYRGGHAAISSITPTALAVNSIVLALWVFWFTPAWVRIAAEAYAERLLGALETL